MVIYSVVYSCAKLNVFLRFFLHKERQNRLSLALF